MEQKSDEIVKSLVKKLQHLELRDFIVEYRKPPPYLSCFLNDEDQNIIFIYIRKKKIKKMDDTIAMMMSNTINTTSGEGDITGNPLELSADEIENLVLEDSVLIKNGEPNILEKDTHVPISASIALNLHSYSNMHLKPGIPIWILSDATDLQKSVLIGSLRKGDTSMSSWITVQGKSKSDKLNISAILEKHFQYTAANVNRVPPISEAASKINILDSDRDTIHGSAFVHASWKKPSVEIPSDCSSLTLELNVKVGEECSPLHSLWQQLLLLQKYFDIVAEWKRSNSLPQYRAKVILPTSRGIFMNENPELSSTERIIDALMSPPQWNKNYTKVKSFEEVLLSIKNCSVPGIDLIGRLWIVLSESCTYEELIDNTSLLFQQAKKCLTTKPFISSQSQCKMADIIRFLLKNPGKLQMMYEPLELLVEMGVEYLKNNYIAAFVQSGLAKEENLNVPNCSSFVTTDNFTWIKTISSYINWMAKIHSVAEFVSIANLGIKVKPDISEIIQRMYVNFLDENSPVMTLQKLIESPNLKFETPISRYPGRNNNEDSKYEKWSMKLTTKEKFRTITSCFLQTHDFLFPDNVLFPDDQNLTTVLSETNIGLLCTSLKHDWFLSISTSIVTKVGK